MAEWKIYPITCAGVDKMRWIKEQLILKYKHEKQPSTFLNLRGIYQSERDHERDLKLCKNKPRQDRIVKLAKIDY